MCTSPLRKNSARKNSACLSAVVTIILGATLGAMSVALAQGTTPPAPAASTTGAAPADRLYNNDQPSLAGQVIPSAQDTAAHNPAIFERDQLPTLAHTFNFTDEQRQQIRDALAPVRSETGEMTLTAGTELPQTVAVQPLPGAITAQMPWIKPYNYVKLGSRIAIVDPHLPVVVAVIE